MKKFISFLIVLPLLASISSCNGEGSEGEDINSDSLFIDTLVIDSLINPIDTVKVDSAGYINEEAALTSQIEKTYGVQWDFCDCIVKNDSIEKALMATNDDAVADKIFARSEVVDQHCKEILTTQNTTPDERAAHERKVKRCLKNAK